MNKKDLKDKLFRIKYGVSVDLVQFIIAVVVATVVISGLWYLLLNSI